MLTHSKFRIPNSKLLPHAAPLAFFAALTVVWSWPLARHLSDSIPGGPGDNFSFVWNLWWMRYVRATPDLQFFRTNFLFFPFGTTIANHPHTALPAFIAATALKGVSLAAAQNVMLLACVFLNMAGAYALAWTLTRHRRGAVLAGIVFGLSPYFSAHLLGHFDLMAGWVLPFFALPFHLAVQRRSTPAAIAAGLVLAAATYTAYYYVVYIALFAAAYTLAAAKAITLSRHQGLPTTRALRAALGGLITLAMLALVLAAWIAVTGGAAWQIGRMSVSLRQAHNPLSLMWLALLAAALCALRPTVAFNRDAPLIGPAIRAGAWIAVVFAIACAPIIVQAVQLVRRGEYVTQTYFWRSAPRGVDLMGPLVGHPRHPLTRTISQSAFKAMHADYIESVAWIGIAPVLLLIAGSRTPASADSRVWWSVAAVFALWAAGPFLTIAGFDTGLWLPEALARYLPFVENARVPGRAMVGVYLALGILIAITVSRSSGALRWPALQRLAIAAVVFEYFAAPVPLTRLDDPPSYRALAAAPPGAVCEVPFGIGDGLGGAGSQDRTVLFYATIHAHPLAGGYIGRMPADAERRYEALPVTSELLRLSRRAGEHADGPRPVPGLAQDAAAGPCRYLIVNRDAASEQLQAYVRTLPVELMASDAKRDVYRLGR